MTIHFAGPYFFSAGDGPPLQSAPDIDRAGLYLLAYRTRSGETLVEYVGESGLFRQRLTDHLGGMLSLEYRVLNTDALADGRPVHEWDGFFRLRKHPSNDLFSLSVDRFPAIQAHLLGQLRADPGGAGRLIAPDLRFRRGRTDIAIELTVTSSEPLVGFPSLLHLPKGP